MDSRNVMDFDKIKSIAKNVLLLAIWWNLKALKKYYSLGTQLKENLILKKISIVGNHFEGNNMKTPKMLPILTSSCVVKKSLQKTFIFLTVRWKIQILKKCSIIGTHFEGNYM